MPRSKPWLKMWVEWLDNPKMNRLTLSEQACWWRLVSFAQRCAADGSLVTSSGSPLTLTEIISGIHISTPEDTSVFESMLKKMELEESLVWDSHVLHIVHFAERQELAPSQTKEALAERQRKHREKLRARESPLESNKGTPLIDKDKEEEEEEESHDQKLVTKKGISESAVTEKSLQKAKSDVESNGKVVTPPKNADVKNLVPSRKIRDNDPILAEISKLFEENIGLITPLLGEKFKDFADNYRGPPEWIKDAFQEAAARGKHNWGYVEAILNNWQVEGRKDERKGKQRRDDAAARDSGEMLRKKGWKVNVSEAEPATEQD